MGNLVETDSAILSVFHKVRKIKKVARPGISDRLPNLGNYIFIKQTMYQKKNSLKVLTAFQKPVEDDPNLPCLVSAVHIPRRRRAAVR